MQSLPRRFALVCKPKHRTQTVSIRQDSRVAASRQSDAAIIFGGNAAVATSLELTANCGEAFIRPRVK